MDTIRRSRAALQISFWLVIILLAPALACADIYVAPTQIAPHDLAGKNFRSSDLSGMNLSNKILQRADLEAGNLLGTNFSGADLRDANLSFAKIIETNFTGADLRGAKFNNSCLDAKSVWTDAKLDEKWARFISIVNQGIRPGMDLRGYDLSNVCLQGYDLTGSNLERVNLSGATILGSDLSNGNLTNSNLENATVHNLSLRNTNLMGANLRGTDIYRVVLTGAQITNEQLDSAVLTCVRMPDGTVAGECNAPPPEP